MGKDVHAQSRRISVGAKPSLRPDRQLLEDSDKTNICQTTPDQQKFIARKLMEALESSLLVCEEGEAGEDKEAVDSSVCDTGVQLIRHGVSINNDILVVAEDSHNGVHQQVDGKLESKKQ